MNKVNFPKKWSKCISWF